jgi:hypothetical protein
MTSLVFELFSDVTAPHPYFSVYLLKEGEPYDPGKFNPFMEFSVEKNSELVLTIYEHAQAISLTLEQWNEISRRAREYHENVLSSGEEW